MGILRMVFLACAVLVVNGSCREPGSPRSDEQRPGRPDPRADANNLLGFFNGAVIIHRTGELALGASALSALDGERGSVWSTPPGDTVQSMTVALPARSRITQVGLSNANLAFKSRTVQSMRFEGSDDGVSFRLIGDITVNKLDSHQLTQVDPVDVSFVRVTNLSSFGSKEASDVVGVEVRGKELEPAKRGSVAGSWSINEEPARFAASRSAFHGVMETSPPTYMEGGWNGRVIRFIWFRGEEYGLGLLSVEPRSQALNGFFWYREPIPPFFGGPWFGARTQPAEGTLPVPRVVETFLQNRGRVPVFQIEFDERNNLVPGSDASTFRRALRVRPRGITINLHEVCDDPEAVEPNQRMTARARSLETFLIAEGIEKSLIRFQNFCNPPKDDWPAGLLTGPFTSFVEIDLRASR